jgi:hypothetical protein
MRQRVLSPLTDVQFEEEKGKRQGQHDQEEDEAVADLPGEICEEADDEWL